MLTCVYVIYYYIDVFLSYPVCVQLCPCHISVNTNVCCMEIHSTLLECVCQPPIMSTLLWLNYMSLMIKGIIVSVSV